MTKKETLAEIHANGHQPATRGQTPLIRLPLRPWNQITAADGQKVTVPLATFRPRLPNGLSPLGDISSLTEVDTNAHEQTEVPEISRDTEQQLTPRLFKKIRFDSDSGLLGLTGDQKTYNFCFQTVPKKVILDFVVSHLGQVVMPGDFKSAMSEAGLKAALDRLSKHITVINETVGGEIPFIQKFNTKAGTAYLLPDLRKNHPSFQVEGRHSKIDELPESRVFESEPQKPAVLLSETKVSGNDIKEAEPTLQSIDMSGRQAYELATMLLRANGKVTPVHEGKAEVLQLPKSLLAACEQLRNAPQFSELVNQLLSPADTPSERKKAVICVLQALENPDAQFKLEEKHAELQKPFMKITQALSTEPLFQDQSVWKNLCQYFGLIPQKTQVFPKPSASA